VCFALAGLGANTALLLEDRILFPEGDPNHVTVVDYPLFGAGDMQIHAAVLRTIVRAAPPPADFIASQLNSPGGCYLKHRCLLSTVGDLQAVLTKVVPTLVDQVAMWALRACARDANKVLAVRSDPDDGTLRWTLASLQGPPEPKPQPSLNMVDFEHLVFNTMSTPTTRGQALGYVPTPPPTPPTPTPPAPDLRLPGFPESITVKKSAVSKGFMCPLEEMVLFIGPNSVTWASLPAIPPAVFILLMTHLKSQEDLISLVASVSRDVLLGGLVLVVNTFPPMDMYKFGLRFRDMILRRADMQGAIVWTTESGDVYPTITKQTMAAETAPKVSNTAAMGSVPWCSKTLSSGSVVDVYTPSYDEFRNIQL
jgi:hypothetical protein